MKNFLDKKQSAFTIVELLVVIVVIGILAGITIVSYTGISNRATIASIQSDLSNASKQLKMFHIENSVYPTTISTNCTTTPTTATNLCLKASPGNSYTAVAYTNPTPQSFILTEVNGNNTYHITENSTPIAGIYVAPTLAVTDPANWLAIGTQVWAKYNLNVGTMITGTITQADNSILQKYCYNNIESNCTTYGALYQWDEAMQYVTTPGAQGICPVETHIPTDDDWKILEVQLGMTQIQADALISWRGTDQGDKMKSGGISGLNILLSGYRSTSGTFVNISSSAYMWSSTSSGSLALDRFVDSTNTTVYRGSDDNRHGFSVRCIAD